MEIAKFSTNITEKTQLADRVFQIKTTRPDGFHFLAGQFVQFILPSPDEKPILRSYSLASSPADPYLEYCIKLFDGGVASGFIEKATTRDTIQFQGPRGRFVNTHQTPLVCIATGTGLAPIISMLEDELVHKKNPNPIQLLFGVRTQTDLFYIDRIHALQQQYPHFQAQITLSQPTPDWTGLQGRVTAHLQIGVPNSQYFICGNGDMVKDIRELLVKQQVDIQHIHFEVF